LRARFSVRRRSFWRTRFFAETEVGIFAFHENSTIPHRRRAVRETVSRA
jgi:hypothetical protein